MFRKSRRNSLKKWVLFGKKVNLLWAVKATFAYLSCVKIAHLLFTSSPARKMLFNLCKFSFKPYWNTRAWVYPQIPINPHKSPFPICKSDKPCSQHATNQQNKGLDLYCLIQTNFPYNRVADPTKPSIYFLYVSLHLTQYKSEATAT